MLNNSQGKVFYGLHFYPGLAEYSEGKGEGFRVFLNENTIRKMDPTFAGRPVFVMHVDGVEDSVDELRKDADGWVVESFFNQADGKHWVKFIVVSEKGFKAIDQGMRLSNCYLPTNYGPGGMWNGMTYEKEVIEGVYEHLAIVPNPRYEESVILNPEAFKRYNEEKTLELKRLSNERKPMLKFWKKEKVENSVDLAETLVSLPKSGRDVTLSQLVLEADEAEAAKGKPRMANEKDEVMAGDAKMTVGDLVSKHQAMYDELEKFKKMNVEGCKNEEDKKDEEKKEEGEEKKANAKEEEVDLEGKARAEALKNAGPNNAPTGPAIETMRDQVARGKSRYGSGK